MGITTFTYSKFIAWTGTTFFSGVIVFCLYLGLSNPPAHNKWLYLIGLISVVCILLGYFCKKCFFPMLQGKVALELDDEKLQFYISNRVIYWKDVEEITKQYGKNSLYLSFEMTDGGDNIEISTKWISGKGDAIFNVVEQYFAESLK